MLAQNIPAHTSQRLFFRRSISFIMSLLALSTDAVSSERKYIRVVFSESCPIALLIVDSGTLFDSAMRDGPRKA